ncbi:MAG: hypothetical protein K9J13_02920 [Saprospiraceae bacterium]|nr:hypothetical protein [Saprospiraceae bacterium]
MKHFKTLLKTLFYIIIGIALFSSCSQKYSEEIAKIDSLQTSLNIVEQRLYELDSNHVFSIYDKYKDTWARLNKAFPEDKDENWDTFCAFENIKSGIKGYKKRYSNLVNELKKSRLQLDNFEKDLKNETLDIEKFEEYYNSEAQAIFELSVATNITIDNAKESVIRFDSLSPIIEEIIVKYQEIKNLDEKTP